MPFKGVYMIRLLSIPIFLYFISLSSLSSDERIQIALASIQMAKDYINEAQDHSQDYQVVEDSCFSAYIFLRNAEAALNDLRDNP